MIGGLPASRKITVLYDGWQIGDGVIVPPRVGTEFRSHFEFVRRSDVKPAAPGARPRLVPLHEHWYDATADVLEADEMVVLDVGDGVRLTSWTIAKVDGPAPYQAGTTVDLQLSVNIGVWGDRDCRRSNPIERHGAEHALRIDRILVPRRGGESFDDVAEVDGFVVDAGDYCLLECAFLDDDV